MKKFALAILCLLWSGFFCLFALLVVPPAAQAQGAPAFTQVIHPEKFAEIAQQKIESTLLAAGETRRHELQLIRAPQLMELPPGEVVCEAELPQKIRYGGTNPVHLRVFVNGQFYRRAICYYRVSVYDKVLVAAHDLRIDKAITAADVRLEERRVLGGAGRYLTKVTEVAGRVPARVIKEGTAVESVMLQQPIVIDVGAPVTLRVKYHGIEVSANGIAMQRGRLGAKIRVRNVASGKILRGTVVDAATVEIVN
ncbi:flagella basal body P-ring formation protein FlgA [Selenomonas sp. GACV-9]|uniref:flagellar basal body P-ring formation chaperone FlgA n=1 Tax=Selenomonas sp. GACV-9 TaxID=3158782 RepID=UPI0008F0654F|nr:flagella basal body P-ring formation protein FlgA [Selenomonas ruminantium]